MPTACPTASVVRALALATMLVATTAAAASEADETVQALKRLSLDELASLTVTSVTKSAQPLTESPSAVQVITREEIRRTGATSIPEVLRLASNLQVAQIDSAEWAISARGFNDDLANKLLVLIDGRSVYSPLHAGVFWADHDTLLEDVDRIEIISGPGGALWGANAVNGVINIITRSAEDTHGEFVEAASGPDLDLLLGARHGGQLGDKVHYRVHGRYVARDATTLPGGLDADDEWHRSEGRVRFDWDASERDRVTVQGDRYEGTPNPDGGEPTRVRGGNLLARWTRTLAGGAETQLQAYVDMTRRNLPPGLEENADAYDVDWQHRLRPGDRHAIMWGFGHRHTQHEIRNIPVIGFLPTDKTLRLWSGFVQDEIRLGARTRLTLGTKLEHHPYVGLEVQPSVRIAFRANERHLAWGAVSRAIRAPSRIDRDFFAPSEPPFGLLAGGPGFVSEELLAFEAGWRVQPRPGVMLSIAAYYNLYDNLRSIEPANAPPGSQFPLTIGNGIEGDSHGLEVTSAFQLARWCRLRAGYAHVNKSLSVKEGSFDINEGVPETNDAEHQLVVHSSMDLGRDVELDVVFRWVDALPEPAVNSRTDLDVRLGWSPVPAVELSLVGRHLIEGSHPEFASTPGPNDIGRSVHAAISWRF